MQTPVQIEKEIILNENGAPVVDGDGKPEYRSGFKIGGGIDQDNTMSPQHYPDKV